MARHFERFMGGPWKSSRDRVHVTLNSKGVFQLNRRAFELLGSPDAVALSFDKTTSTIGLEKVQPKLTEAFPLNERQNMYWTINAIPFYRYCGVKLAGTEVFNDPEMNNDKSPNARPPPHPPGPMRRRPEEKRRIGSLGQQNAQEHELSLPRSVSLCLIDIGGSEGWVVSEGFGHGADLETFCVVVFDAEVVVVVE